MARQIPMRQSLWDPLGEDVLGPVLQLLSQSDLHALSLVSKASRATTEPFLYSKIEWTWVEDQPHPIAPFLRTILRRPELAAYVRSMALPGDLSIYCNPKTKVKFRRGSCFDDRLPKVSIDGLDLEKAVKVIRTTMVPYAHRWEEELLRGIMDAFVALLLSQLYNLRHLALGPSIAKQSQLIGMLFTSVLCEKVNHGLPIFRHLREVTFEINSYSGWTLCGRNTASVLPFFYLPELQYLSVALDNPVTLSWPMNTPPNPSTITSLDLTYIREANLSSLLSVTPLLKTLRWKFYYRTRFQHASNMPLVDLDGLGTALIHVRDTLEALTISAYCDSGNNLDPPLIYMGGALTALVDFCQLERLEIPLQFLVAGFLPATGVLLKNVVPRHICSLTITDDLQSQYEQNEWDDEALYNVIKLWLQDSAPKSDLRTISLLLNQTDDNWGPEMRQSLTELCDQCGFEAKITKKLADMAK